MSRIQKGRFAEKLAQNYLLKKGYKILKSNYRTRESEIDLICISPDGILCFVEVRSGITFNPVESVNLKKVQKIIKGALSFVSEINWDGDIRFDVIVVHLKHDNPIIQHIIAAFEET